MTETISISCDACSMQHTPLCSDCLVSVVCRDDVAMPLVMGRAEVRAVSLLERAGLVPELRHRPRTPVPGGQ